MGAEHLGLPKAFLRPSGPLFPLSIKERPWVGVEGGLCLESHKPA